MDKMESIKNIFKNYTPSNIQKIKKVAVFIALININSVEHIIFQKRSDNVNQSGDISFIGGHIEKDESPYDAIIRETMEECNLKKENIEIFGQSDYMLTYAGLFVYVFVGRIKNINFSDIKANEEVERMYAIPLEKILNQGFTVYNLKMSLDRPTYFPYELISNGQDYKFFLAKYPMYFYEFKDCTIWGLTANILHSFVDIIKLS